MNSVEGLGVLAIALFAFTALFGFYFLPTILAFAMHNSNVLAIALLNTFGGWTGLGWLGALIWAVII